MIFVIFHGSFGSPEGNWFPQLKSSLESFGQKVFIPEFPVDNWDKITELGVSKAVVKNQNLENWLNAFDSFWKTLPKNQKICFIGHSLGCVFILHILEKYKIKLDCAIFVSPFLDIPMTPDKSWQIDLVNKTFYKTNFDFDRIKNQINSSYSLYSDNDPYVDRDTSIDFATKLNSSAIMVRGAVHMNKTAGLSEFPLVLELCKTRIDLTLYQKYLAHRRELYALDYVNPKTEEVIYLTPKEIFDEGVFKFRNLEKSGFCTYPTSVELWNEQNLYFQQARLTARRMKDFTRVFIITHKKELENEKIRNLIKLDLESGIKCYLCKKSDIQNSVSEFDFGIWDEEYICLVENESGKPSQVRLSSRKKDVELGNEWKKIILKKAIRILKVEDIDNF